MERRWGKIVLLVSVCLLLLAQTAGAEKIDFKDDKYNFKQIKNVVIYDMDFSDVELNSSIMEKSLNSTYLKKAEQEKVPIISIDSVLRRISLHSGKDMDLLAESDFDEFNKVYYEHLPEYAQVYVEAKLLQYESKSVYHPAYTSWETRRESTYVWDNNGNKIRVEEDVLVPVENPAYYETVFYDKIEFHVYDAKTGAEVFSRQEWRERTGDDGTGMFGRICAAFFSDLRKLAR